MHDNEENASAISSWTSSLQFGMASFPQLWTRFTLRVTRSLPYPLTLQCKLQIQTHKKVGQKSMQTLHNLLQLPFAHYGSVPNYMFKPQVKYFKSLLNLNQTTRFLCVFFQHELNQELTSREWTTPPHLSHQARNVRSRKETSNEILMLTPHPRPSPK